MNESVLTNVMSLSGLINGQKLITPTKSNLIKAMNHELQSTLYFFFFLEEQR